MINCKGQKTTFQALSRSPRLRKDITWRSIVGEKLHFQAGSLAHVATPKHLPDYMVLIPCNHNRASQINNKFAPLPAHQVYQQLAIGSFDHANGVAPERTFVAVDFTHVDTMLPHNVVLEEDITVCGQSFQRLELKKGEEILLLFQGGVVPLVWGQTTDGDFFFRARYIALDIKASALFLQNQHSWS